MSSVAEVGQRLKASVEQVAESTLGDFSKEQQKFVANKHRNEAVGALPWAGCKNEEEVETQVMALSSDRRNVLRDPPAGAKPFAFDFSQNAGAAQSMLDVDERLRALRFELVPKAISEERFWRNYFYRVNLIRAAAEHADGHPTHAAAASAADPASSDIAGEAAGEGPGSSTAVGAHSAAAAAEAGTVETAAAEAGASSAAVAVSVSAAGETGEDRDETASNASFAEREQDQQLPGDMTADLQQLGLAVPRDEEHSKAESSDGKARSDDFDLLDEELQAELASLGTDDQSAAAIEAEIDTMLKDA